MAGQLLAGVAGAGLTYQYGRKLVNEYHEMASEVLAELSK